MRQYCKFPSNGEDFKDIITDNVWQNDKVFVEQRLAGLNPMSIRKLNLKGIKYFKGWFCRHFFNMDTSYKTDLIRTLCCVPSASVLKMFDCTN